MKDFKRLQIGNKTPLRVAAYCRVSRDGRQDGSFETQRDFFINGIVGHPGWELGGLYADQGKTGTQIRGRTDFQRMMRHARTGKFDYILAKSISRFSRSVSDTIKSIRELTDLGIGVYFLEEDFDTGSINGEMVISILASVAEMESESISQNIKITQEAKNELGTPVRKCAYGYKRDGINWVIDPKKAVRVKVAFLMAANGFCFTEIAVRLNQLEEVDETGKHWVGCLVRSLLQNEAYVGDILTNKTVIVRGTDAKRQVVNDNIVDKFYIDHHHEPMVSRRLFKKVNKMLTARKLAGQDAFRGVDELKALAGKDHLLDSVRTLLPKNPGKYMKLLKERVNQNEKDRC